MNATTTQTTNRFETIMSAIAAAQHEADLAIQENPACRREIEQRLAKQIRVLEHIPC